MFLNKIRNFKKIKKVKKFFPELDRVNRNTESDDRHLDLAMKWLARAQDSGKNGGVSAYYDLIKEDWGVPYRETTGYIIPTFINYYLISNDEDYEKRAVEMADWEIREQCPDGAIGEIKSNGDIGKKIFNTGQVILGFCSMYEHTKDQKYLSSATKGAEWLIKNQESDGRWEKFSTQGAKTYDSRVAWSLLELYKKTGDTRLKDSAEENIDWAIKQQLKNGWFKNTSLSNPDKPWTHLIAYTITGLIESSQLLSGEIATRAFESGRLAAEKILEYYGNGSKKNFNYLPSTFTNQWQSRDKYSCLTGDAQMATIWLKLYSITKDKKFYDGAVRMIEQLKKLQIMESGRSEIIGTITGSYPFYGAYAGFLIPNWGVKFFADALIMKNYDKITLLS